MVNPKKVKWLIEFVPNYSILIVDLIIRIILLIPVIMKIETFNYGLNIFLQIFTTAFTLYIANRKSKTIRSFLEMRLLSDQSEDKEILNEVKKKSIQFKNVELKTKTVGIREDGIFVFLLFLIPVLSVATIFGQFVVWKDFKFLQNIINVDLFSVLCVFITGPLFYFLYWWKKDLFISRKLILVKKNGRILSKKKLGEFVEFISRKFTLNQEVALSEQNDFLIIELQTKIKIFRQRLENLSMEGVFLGALSFATLMQLIGPENIEVLSEIAFNKPGDDKYFTLLLHQFNTNQSWFISKEIRIGIGIAFITVGSLLASVFYIIVLIKRFSILKSIELAQLKIERANSWNEREENEINEKNMLKMMRFTDQIQIELASASQICQEIHSNISLVSFFRSLGIFSFFTVILVTAGMIHHYLFIFSLFVTMYGFTASLLMSHSNGFFNVIRRKKWEDPEYGFT